MAWNLSGRYMETCNCDYLCPCGPSGLAKSTHGFCVFAMGFEVEKGDYNGTNLAGRKMVLLCKTPGEMIDGSWRVGLILDDNADQKQREALTAIISGQAGGPMANLGPLIGQFVGVETAPIKFEGNGKDWSFSAGPFADHACEGATGLGGEQMYLEGIGHPVNSKLAIGRAKRSHTHALGFDWDQVDGRNNGHFAPFAWNG
jgi:hypothetical protein